VSAGSYSRPAADKAANAGQPSPFLFASMRHWVPLPKSPDVGSRLPPPVAVAPPEAKLTQRWRYCPQPGRTGHGFILVITQWVSDNGRIGGRPWGGESAAPWLGPLLAVRYPFAFLFHFVHQKKSPLTSADITQIVTDFGSPTQVDHCAGAGGSSIPCRGVRKRSKPSPVRLTGCAGEQFPDP